MHVDIKKLPKSQVDITIRLIWSEWKESFEHALENVSKRAKIEGFRAGKAPRALLEKHVGKGAILAEATDHVIRNSYEKVLREHPEIDAIGRPEADIRQHEEGGDFEYSIRTTVIPDIDLGRWESAIRKARKECLKKEASVGDDEVQIELQKLAESRAKFVSVEREARIGDSVEVDFRVLQDGIPIENGTAQGHRLVLGKGVFIPGFEEALQGMRPGQDTSFDLSFPDDYHAKHLAGKPAHFEVTLKTVESRDIPALDDAFAASLGNFENIDALRKNISDGLLAEKQSSMREECRASMIDALVSSAEADIPELLLAEERGKMLAELELQLSNIQATLDDFLEKSKKTREDLEKESEPQARKRVLSALALEKIAKDRDIEPSNDEIEEEMNRTLRFYRSVKQIEKDVDLGRLHQYAKGRLRNEKVLEFLETLD